MVRILSQSTRCVPRSRVQEALRDVKGVVLNMEGTDLEWSSLSISGPAAVPVLRVSRRVRDDIVDDLRNFRASLAQARPESGARWAHEFLGEVQTLYELETFRGATAHPDVLGVMVEVLRQASLGIVQADGEGFSNQAGSLVASQFAPRAKGKWTVAVLIDGRWIAFNTDLDDDYRFSAFLEGRLPLDA